MQLGLEGLGVLVTGGAGGIGAATVRAFAAEGARVAVHYRSSAEAAEALAAEVGGVVLRADLAIEAEADALVPAAVAALGRLDVCVANAGAFDATPTPIWESSLERFRAGIEANLVTTWLTCRGFLRHVKETGEGSLVLVGSTAGIVGEAGHAEYASAKGAINVGLVRTLKNEIVQIAPRGRVNVVAPGWTATPMVAETLDDAMVQRATRTYALRKVATPEEVASAIVWVASPRAGTRPARSSGLGRHGRSRDLVSEEARVAGGARVVAIVGGASGMGAASARRFAAAGDVVVVLDRNDPAEGALPVGVDVRRLDVTDSAACDAAVAGIVRDHGRLDVLVNAAGIIARMGTLDTSDDDWRRIFAVNLDGLFYASWPPARCSRRAAGRSSTSPRSPAWSSPN